MNLFKILSPQNNTLKMYVLVRKELETNYRHVQGSHASIEYTKIFSDTELFKQWCKNPYLIHLGIRFPSELYKWMKVLTSNKISYYSWKEPDLDNEITAICCINSGEIFKNLPLA